jgi:hypothetical protein
MATSPIYSWPEPDNTDLVKNGALAIRTLGNAIDTTMGTMTPKSIVDAKGDIIAASANDTPARLAVGSNGDTLIADSSATTGLRYNPQNALSNPVINGGLDIWQRGTTITSFTTPTSIYSADRWFGSNNTGMTISRQATGDTTNLPNVQYCARIQRNNLSTAGNLVGFSQSIETSNSIPYSGKIVTLSFYARVGANFSGGLAGGTAFSVQLYSGTGTDQRRDFSAAFTGESTVASITPTLTSTWQRFAVTGTVGATSTELAILAYYGASTAASGAADYFEITGVQIDFGTYTSSSAPTFRRSGGTIEGELANCQRYYYRAIGGNNNSAYGMGMGTFSNNANFIVQLPVTFRTVASTTIESGNICISDGVTAYAGGTFTSSAVLSSQNVGFVNYTHTAATLTQFRPYRIENNSSTAGYIAFSAEL